jgi:hypothetical protein
MFPNVDKLPPFRLEISFAIAAVCKRSRSIFISIQKLFQPEHSNANHYKEHLEFARVSSHYNAMT